MKLDVFLTRTEGVGTLAHAGLRAQIAGGVIAAWSEPPFAGQFRLHVVRVSDAGERHLPLADSQRARRAYAAAHAESDPYLLVDDDVLPGRFIQGGLPPGVDLDGRPWEKCPFARTDAIAEYLRTVFATHPKLAAAAPWIIPDRGVGPRGVDGEKIRDRDLYRDDAIGWIRVVRRGVLPARVSEMWPAVGAAYDGIEARYLRSRAWDLGTLWRWRAHHLGYRSTTVHADEKREF